MSCDVIRKRSC